MPFFYYEAKNSAGKRTSGILEARDERELAWQLKKEGYFPVKIKLKKEKTGKESLSGGFSLFKRVPLMEKVIFTRHLGVLIKGGVSLPRALAILAEQTKSPYFGKVLRDISGNIKKGVALHEAFGSYPDVFPKIYVSMVEVGEVMGKLDETLNILAIQMRKEHELKSKIRGAMVYPGVVLGAMVGIGILMMIVVIPRVSKIFDELNVELPLPTRVLIFTSDFLKNHYLLTLFVMVLLGVGLRFFIKSTSGKKIIDLLMIKVPFLKNLIIKYNSARFCRSLASLLGGGVPIVKALKIVSSTVSNFYYERAVEKAAAEVKRGIALNVILKENEEIFPALVVQMVKVGEETGMSSEVLKQLADFYEQEVDTATKSLSSIVEPVLMVVLGAAVGFFAVSMLQPMYSIVDVIE